MGHILGTTSDSSIVIIGLPSLAAGTLTPDEAGTASTLYQRQAKEVIICEGSPIHNGLRSCVYEESLPYMIHASARPHAQPQG